VEIWAGEANLNEAARYSGGLTASRAIQGDGRWEITVLEADPMITLSKALAEEFFDAQPMRLLDRLRIDGVDGPVIYIVRGIDTDTGTYYLSWPD
jgi:hypothetical protein